MGVVGLQERIPPFDQKNRQLPLYFDIPQQKRHGISLNQDDFHVGSPFFHKVPIFQKFKGGRAPEAQRQNKLIWIYSLPVIPFEDRYELT